MKDEKAVATVMALRGVVELMVDQPNEVRVMLGRVAGDDVVVDIDVAAGDVGKVIGRKGETAEALRVLLRRMARHGVRYHLNINGAKGKEGANV